MLPNPNLPAVGPMWLNRDSRAPACWNVSILTLVGTKGFFSITMQAKAFDPKPVLEYWPDLVSVSI